MTVARYISKTTRAGGRGFTLIELLVVIAVIALLIAITLVAVRGAMRSAGGTFDKQAARSLSMGMDQFKGEFGFGVPLVFDGAPMEVDGPAVVGKPGIRPLDNQDANIPAYENTNANPVVSFVSVYSRAADIDFLRGGRDHNNNQARAKNNNDWEDSRYSKASLAIYLGGSLDRTIDGADGNQMSQPSADGSFKGRAAGRGSAKTFEPFIAVGDGGIELRKRYENELEYEEHGDDWLSRETDRPFGDALIDRHGRAYRFYRWENGRNSDDAASADEQGRIEDPADLNIPGVLQNALRYLEQQTDRTIDATDGDTKLRSASWAIVGAGPDGLFGTEDITDLGGNAGMPATEQAAMRAAAMKDNVVEVGQ